jgi:hypothetical protein
MAKKPEPPKPTIWTIYKIAANAVWLGEVDAPRGASGRKGAGRQEAEVIFCAAGVLSATPLTYSLRRYDSDFAVFCFVNLEDAEAFAGRFGDEQPGLPLETSGRPERAVPTMIASMGYFPRFNETYPSRTENPRFLTRGIHVPSCVIGMTTLIARIS